MKCVMFIWNPVCLYEIQPCLYEFWTCLNELRPIGSSCCKNVYGYDWMAASRIRVHRLIPPCTDAREFLQFAVGDDLAPWFCEVPVQGENTLQPKTTSFIIVQIELVTPCTQQHHLRSNGDSHAPMQTYTPSNPIYFAYNFFSKRSTILPPFQSTSPTRIPRLPILSP